MFQNFTSIYTKFLLVFIYFNTIAVRSSFIFINEISLYLTFNYKVMIAIVVVLLLV